MKVELSREERKYIKQCYIPSAVGELGNFIFGRLESLAGYSTRSGTWYLGICGVGCLMLVFESSGDRLSFAVPIRGSI